MATNSIRNSLAALSIVLLFVFAAFCILAFPADASAATREYGSLCSKYESSNNPFDIDSNCAYGAYQMSTGNAYKFAMWLRNGAGKNTSDKNRNAYINWGTALVAGYVSDGKSCGTNFDNAWKAVSPSYSKLFAMYSKNYKSWKIVNSKNAVQNSDLFFTLQYDYCKTNYYDEAVAIWKSKASGFNPDKYSIALRSVIFSTAIQHGPTGSGYVWGHVLDTIGGWQTGMAEDILINAIYDERSKLKSDKKTLAYFPGYTIDNKAGGYGIYQRLNINERADALKLMKENGGICSHSSKTGGTATYSVVSETKHKVTTSAVKCKSCGAVLKAKSTKTVSHSFKCSGKNYKCVCGQKLIVHAKGKYYRVKTELNLRSSASTSSKVKTSLPKNKVLKAISAKKGSDGNWWLKVKYSGKTGYVRAYYMEVHGTGCSNHVYKNGKCKYCKVAKSVLTKNKIAGTYKTAAAITTYKAAYTESARKGTLSSGSTVVVTKVVKNRYNTLWGKTSNGAYVDITYLKR